LSQHLSSDDLKKTIVQDLNKLAGENKFNSLEKIKQLHLVIDPFTIENDLLTPTMKVKRNVAKKVFDKEINDLYTKPVIN
jgi:long-chain acyl-CoA synthetase